MTQRRTSVADAGTEFDRTTSVTPLDEGRFAVDLDDRWSSLVGIHGGYLTAIVVRCVEAAVVGRTVRTISTRFERPVRTGPAIVAVRESRRGRSLSSVVADVSQDGRPVATTRITLVAPHTGAVDWSTTGPLPIPPPEQCVPLDPPGPVIHFDRADALIDPAILPFTGAQRTRVQGYIRPLESRPIDASWLAMASDYFPPPAFVRFDPPVGGVSVDLVTHVHRTLPASDGEWLAASFEVATSVGGLATEHGRIARRDGVVLAESFQTRWTVAG